MSLVKHGAEEYLQLHAILAPAALFGHGNACGKECCNVDGAYATELLSFVVAGHELSLPLNSRPITRNLCLSKH